mmetsp:Transcript_25179/g.72573  ORF Transcript_25179/g.72573 Transcript_25179/m.72573 type:complete len:206 (-) Transcript_25179:1612-2229(-)
MAAVCRQHGGLVHSTYDLGEGQDRHVAELRRRHLLYRPARRIMRVLGAREAPPHKQECVAVVFVRGAIVLLDHTVDDLCDLVDEVHDPGLEHLRRHAEVLDAGVADDAIDALAWHHDVHPIRGADHVRGDDLRAGLAEAERQQGTQLDDGLLEDYGLHGLFHLVQVVRSVVEELPERAHGRELLLTLGRLDLLAAELRVAELHRL